MNSAHMPVLAKELGFDVYRAAELAGALREKLLEQQESFVFETVFTDPVGDPGGMPFKWRISYPSRE